MAQYFTDFESGTLDGFTMMTSGHFSIVSSSRPESSGFVVVPAVTSSTWLRWLLPGDVSGAVEVRALMVHAATSGAVNGTGPGARIGGSGTSRRGVAALLSRVSSATRLRGAFMSSGSGTYANGSAILNVGTPIWLSIRESGGQRAARAEAFGSLALLEELLVPQGESTELGVGIWSIGLEAEILALSVGTDGDPAPYGPPAGARRRAPLLMTPW